MSDVELHCGDCLGVMKDMADNSVDAIVCDPPYGLSFMGKKWDYEVPKIEVWVECLRVLKPGGHLLSFAGTRTQHRMCCNIEDAGFGIRDMIVWVYGSGLPKSLDISKAIDRKRYDMPQILQVTTWINKEVKRAGITYAKILQAFGFNKGSGQVGHWTAITMQSQPAVPTLEQVPMLLALLGLTVNELPADMRQLLWYHNGRKRQPGEAWFSREVIGEKASGLSSGTGNTVGRFTDNRNERGMVDITALATDAAKQWDGWGTGLKPAFEPITLARKPISEPTIAANVLKWGTGGINIDGCRVETDDKLDGGATGGSVSASEGWDRPWRHNTDAVKEKIERDKKQVIKSETLGRFPANLIHDGSDEVAGLFPDSKSGAIKQGTKQGFGDSNVYGTSDGHYSERLASAGSAARFFYCAKASKSDRDDGLEGMETSTAGEMTGGRKEGSAGLNSPRSGAGRTTGGKNHHPTVKPTSLMQYLCRLVTPPDGTVLDPFMGSGSTGRGAVKEGFSFIGIEIDPEYFEIAKKRIEATKSEFALFDKHN